MRGLFSKEMETITHSSADCFMECRKKWDYRYRREIVPAETPASLAIGTAVHAGLEFWMRYGEAKGAVSSAISAGMKCGLSAENLIKVEAMVGRYAEVYAQEDWEVVSVEKAFCTKLQNPQTLRYSRTFSYEGKIDAIVRRGNAVWIVEHKTAAKADDAYAETLELRAQAALYAAAQEADGVPVRGVIFDIIEKPGIKMALGETEEEFEARKAALLAKSKTGKTSATRREPETTEEFLERCREKLAAECFRRVEIPIPLERRREAMADLWRIAKDMRHAQIYANTGACNAFGKRCPYIELCRAHGNLAECGDIYTTRKAHCELEEAEP